MSINIQQGNIFSSKCQTIVNTVNCVGVMGAGIALECRLRYPEMYEQYESLCKRGLFEIGSLWIYKAPERWILNFPTKKHWKYPTKEEYLHAGLRKFMQTYEEKKIESIAFPLLGAQHGGLDQNKSLELMESYLHKCTVPVEIYRYDPMAQDDLYDNFRSFLLNMSPEQIKKEVGVRSDIAIKILDALKDESICQLNKLATVDGIGHKTIEKAFSFVRTRLSGNGKPIQQTLGF